jgi:hypothetical protein
MWLDWAAADEFDSVTAVKQFAPVQMNNSRIAGMSVNRLRSLLASWRRKFYERPGLAQDRNKATLS